MYQMIQADRFPPLLVSGHGTADQEGVDEFMALVDKCAKMRPHIDVRAGFIELSPPPLGESIAELYAMGHKHMISVPLMLFDAGHSKTDIPASLNIGKGMHPGLDITYAKPLGIHTRLIEAINKRLEAAVPADERAETGVLIVGRGASDPASNSRVAQVARLIWEGRDWPEVEIAFIGITRPKLQEGLDKLKRLGYKKIVVIAYFLFTGVLEQRIRNQSIEWGKENDIQLTVADYFGPDDLIAEMVWLRYDETVTGSIDRDCDTCIHRFKTDGFEHKLNSPLVPHEHPDDPNTHGHHHGHGHHHHGHGHSHGHGHGHGHAHGHGHSHGHDHGRANGHGHAHEDGHDHGAHAHDH